MSKKLAFAVAVLFVSLVASSCGFTGEPPVVERAQDVPSVYVEGGGDGGPNPVPSETPQQGASTVTGDSPCSGISDEVITRYATGDAGGTATINRAPEPESLIEYSRQLTAVIGGEVVSQCAIEAVGPGKGQDAEISVIAFQGGNAESLRAQEGIGSENVTVQGAQGAFVAWQQLGENRIPFSAAAQVGDVWYIVNASFTSASASYWSGGAQPTREQILAEQDRVVTRIFGDYQNMLAGVVAYVNATPAAAPATEPSTTTTAAPDTETTTTTVKKGIKDPFN